MADQYVIDKWEGRNRKWNLGNRASGLAMLVFGAGISSTNSIPLDIAGCLFMAEGIGDLLSGKHHYISSRIFRYHPKYQKEPTSN